MATESDRSEWPPENLADYYRSNYFLNHIKTLQRRLERSYPNADVEVIVYDAVTDLLVKEIEHHCIYNTFMHRFQTESQFLRYLSETCCSKVIDNARSFQRRFRQLLDEDTVEDSSMGPEEQAIALEEAAQKLEMVRDLETTVINKLPKLDRLILKHRVEGKKFHEIAELLDIGVSTVHRRHKDIIERLANQLEGQTEGKKIRPMR